MTSQPPPTGDGGQPAGWQQPQQHDQPQQVWPQQPQQVWPQQPQQGWPQHPQQGQQQAWPQQQQPQQAWPQQGQPQPQHAWPQQDQQPQQGWPQQQQYQQGAPGYGYAAPQAPELGYGYHPMPHYPAPQFPPSQRPPQRGVPGWVWGVAAALVIAVVGVFALPSVLNRPTEDPTDRDTVTAEPDDGFGEPNTASSGTFTGAHMIETINEALATKDRPAFFRFVDGGAVAPLTLWWENMDVLQWEMGALSVGPGQPTDYVDDTIELRVTLGAATAGSPVIPDGSDHPDAGLSYAPSNSYVATIHVTDDGQSGIITDWQLQSTGAPWDLEPLYAVVSEHAVTAGYADEAALVDSIAPLGETGATWVIETYERETGVANAQRFTTFVTENPDRFNDWFIEDTSGWVADRAGTMFPQRRPYAAAGISADIATGGASLNAGGILTIGPNGILYGAEDTLDTVVHEFIHAIHTTNTPNEAWPGSTAVEGWAVYNESLFRGEGEFAAAGTYIGRMVRSCSASDDFTGAFPTQQDFVDVETVHCAYMLSGSMYAYAASLGVDVYEAADYVLEEGVGLPEASQALGGPVIDAAGWTQWLQANYS